MRPIIYPYKIGSRSARALADELKKRQHKAIRVRPEGSYKLYPNHLIINWGNGQVPNWNRDYAHRLNGCAAVQLASNKLLAFQKFKEAGNVSIPEFTTQVSDVLAALTEAPKVEWFARTKLQGHSGEGIVPIYGGTEYGPEGEQFPAAPLYVKYVKKKDEYRVHVFKGKVIDVQQKRKRKDIPTEEVDFQVRNHSNGWVYCRNEVSPHQSVLDNAINAINALGLDFGAVDIIWNNHHNQAFVLEVNTAPGLEGTTLTKYTDAIEELL